MPDLLELGQEPVWEIQFDETLKQYSAFALYRDLGVDRSLTRVAQKWNALDHLPDEQKPKRGTKGNPLSRLAEWSRRNRWVERAEAYDHHLDRRYRDARETAIARMAATESTLGRTLVSAALQRMTGVDARDDRPAVPPINLAELTAGEVAMLAREGVRISRISTGRPTELVKGALMIHANEYETDMATLTAILFAYIPEDRKPAAAEEVRAFASGERKQLTG